MAERTFLIHRYSMSNWDQVSGLKPFIAAGPKFRAYTTTQTLTGFQWEFRKSLLDDIGSLGPSADQFGREVIAELLLREGILIAMWSINSGVCRPEAERWKASIEQVAAEIPPLDPISESVRELLSGMSEPSHYRNYVSEDELTLEAVAVPDELA